VKSVQEVNERVCTVLGMHWIMAFGKMRACGGADVTMGKMRGKSAGATVLGLGNMLASIHYSGLNKTD